MTPSTHDPQAGDRAALGERIKAMREEKRYTIEVLAARAGMSPNTIRSIERGHKCHRTSIARLIDALNVAPIHTGVQLMREDIEVATLYHHAQTPLRKFVMEILTSSEYADGPSPYLFVVAHELAHLSTDQYEALRALVKFFKERPVKSDSDRRTDPDGPRRTPQKKINS